MNTAAAHQAASELIRGRYGPGNDAFARQLADAVLASQQPQSGSWTGIRDKPDGLLTASNAAAADAVTALQQAARDMFGTFKPAKGGSWRAYANRAQITAWREVLGLPE